MSYRKIGDLIQLVDIRNRDLRITHLVGLTMTKYKIIRKNQFACSTMQVRRDKKMPIALLKEFDEAIISQAYPVFEVNNENEILPDYLMLWFTRSEFDREACFHAVGGVRGSLEWEDFCNMELPVPSIEKQRTIVAQYQSITNKIKVNEQICEKLEATAQALYRQWFVDFEFPNEEGNSYKSSGGVMVYDEELDKEIPEGWGSGKLGELSKMIDGDRGVNYPKKEDFFPEEYCLFLNAGNVTKNGFNFSNCSFITKKKDDILRKGKLVFNDIVLTSRGTVGNLAFYTDIIPYENVRINSGMLIIRSMLEASYLFSMLNSFEFSKSIENYISGSAVPQLPIKDLSSITILIPSEFIMNHFSKSALLFYKEIDTLKHQNLKLTELQSLLLIKIARLNGSYDKIKYKAV